MSAAQKKIVSVVIVCLLIVSAAGITVRNKQTDVPGKAGDTEQALEETGEGNAAYRDAEEELVFWYEDPSYQEFFEKAVVSYYEKTGVKVTAECTAETGHTIDYMGNIYDKTMQDERFPDVYLISGDNLETAYLYGLASVNESSGKNAKVAPKALEASSYRGKVYGYPLSYNTILFVYQNGYFESAPDSIQAIIDYSDQNEPAENVEYLLEWDVNDAFYDFPFISNSVSFEKTERETMNVKYDEELYNQDLAFFEGILASFSVNADTVSEASIIDNFLAGRTLCALIDSDSIFRLSGYSYSLMEIPDLNEDLKAETCASTDMLMVNEFSQNQKAAADFAEYVTVDMADELYGLSGHFSVIPSLDAEWTEQVAYQAYESAVLVPDSQDAKDFWVRLEETISKYF